MFAFFGFFGFALSKDAFDAYSSKSWPTVDGIVIKSDWWHHGGKGCNYGLRFVYNYSIDETTYAGNNYRFGGECDADVSQIALAHPIGSKVQVFYKPGSPDISVISPGNISGNTKTGLFVVPIMLALCIGLVVIIFRARR